MWLGFIDYEAALRSGGLAVEGARTLVRDFPRWFKWSPMARFVRAERARQATAS